MAATQVSASRTHGCETALTEAGTCIQCGEPTLDGGDFCCGGCEAAYSALHEGRKDAETTGDAASGIATLATVQEDGSYRLEVGVEGIHCASCIRLIENALAGEDGVTAARVNMTTERLSLSWQGDRGRGNALAAIVTKLGYKLHPLATSVDAGEKNERELLKSIAIAGFAAGNIMLLSVGVWTSTAQTMGVATRDLLHWVSALIALPSIVYAGRPFFRSAFSVLKEGHTNMDVPISLAILLAAAMSLSETMRHGQHVYFDSATMLMFFLLIGRYLDARAKGKARASAAKLLSRLAGFATVRAGGTVREVPVKDLSEGMEVIVGMGENIPADGRVIKGQSAADMSLISGETLPEPIMPGANVFAGTLNLSAPIELVVTKASEKSLLSEIVRLLETAEQAGAKYVRLADRAARLYTPVVHAMGALTFLGWWLAMQAPWQMSLMHAVTVLIITCPCALGLAVPVVQVLASGRLMKGGVLIKSGDALERLAEIDTVVFDKTGTLTVGKPALVAGDYDDDSFALAAALAAHSKHPLSKALTAAFEGAFQPLDVTEHPGRGLEATLDGVSVQLGSRAWCGPSDAPENGADTHLELWLAKDGVPAARFAFADALRDDAATIVARLQKRGLEVRLLSGDRADVVKETAKLAGITAYEAGVTPVEKCAYLEKLAGDGAKILMVGDGLNDAPALAAAHVSMSPSSAIDITQNTADIVFQGDHLQPVLETLIVSRISGRLVKQNFALAILYNVCAIPMAVLGYVTPMIAAAAMSGSSLVVILNAFRLTLTRKGKA
ncbi:heavy metal translocating P-type ATPase [Kordiimonas marina]|uniref:heavy metal translocating P-type ATPase n=1 Tax=Kordiimonas marina TaxID=2872312 RepID=UPI001FF532D2|nr:copper-translocating P-type ATPase [Kordiimonas marina]MCJ9427748.1 cadmium-translocating P-type ATPase [Kordiimonas marina]